MEGKLKVGVFGAYRGKSMIEALAGHPDAQLVAVCDMYRPLLDSVAELGQQRGLNVSLYEHFEDFFQHDMDAVVLANYAHEHAPYAIRLLQSGRHVLSEVLPCETMAQAVALAEAVEASGKVYAYAENYCYMDHAFEMWRRYRQGDIGEATYAEGEYIHDCSSIWPQITYGQRDHWRNNMYPTFYCTHSLGPILSATGLRPVQVVGFELPPVEEMYGLGHAGGHGGGMEMVTLENGAVVKSIHGGLKREPGSINYQLYGTRGMMETDRFDGTRLSVYREGEKLCQGEFEHYTAQKFTSAELALSSGVAGHNGSDFYATHFFIQKILGRQEGIDYSLDVYQALDMGICGILAYRSILEGNRPVAVPDLRDPAQREAFRHDHACTTPAVAGDALLPLSSYGVREIPDEVYEGVRRLWLEGKNAE